MLKFGHFVSWSFCVIFVFKPKIRKQSQWQSQLQ